MAEIKVTRNDELSRYDVYSDGKHAGFAEFVKRPGNRILFPHTEVFPEFRGGVVAGQLAHEALTDAAASGDTIVPICPFLVKYLHRHEIPGAKIDYSLAGEA
jgi:predicted GNAT family acetyltransferase